MLGFFLDPQSCAAIVSAGVAFVVAAAAWAGFWIAYSRQQDLLQQKRDRQISAMEAEIEIVGSWASGSYTRRNLKSFLDEHDSQTDPAFRILPFKIDAIRTFLTTGDVQLFTKATVEALAHFCQGALNFLSAVAEIEEFKSRHAEVEFKHLASKFPLPNPAEDRSLTTYRNVLSLKYVEIHFHLIGDASDPAGLHSTYLAVQNALAQERMIPLHLRSRKWLFVTCSIFAGLFFVVGLILLIGGLPRLLSFLYN